MYRLDVMVNDIVPLSAMQAGMLAQCQRQSEQSLYIEQMVVQMDGQLDQIAWQQAWQQLHEAHPALRSSIHVQGLPTPHQVIWRAENCPLPFVYHDVTSNPAYTVEQLANQRRRAGFDLLQPGLYQVDLIKLAENSYVQIVTISHLIIDGWSFGVLSSELVQCYFAHLQGTPITLQPAPGINHWLHWQQHQDMDSLAQFWRQALDGAVPGQAPLANRSPADNTTIAEPLQTESLQVLHWTGLQQAQLETGCRRLAITQNSCFQAACALVLARWLQQDDVVMGTTQASRPPEIEGGARILGPLLNTLPLRWQFDWQQSSEAFVQAYHQQLAKTLQQGAMPLAEILQHCDWPTNTAPFEVLTIFQNTASAITPANTPDNTTTQPLQATLLQAQESVGYPMAIYCVPDTEAGAVESTLSLQLRFDNQRWSERLAQSLLDGIRHIMLQLISVDLPLAQLSTTSTPKPLGGQPALPLAGGLAGRLQQLAQQQPDAEAFQQQGRAALRYSELWQQVRQLATILQAHGVTTGQVVGCHMTASPAAFTSLLAVILSGGCFLALDSAYPQARLKTILTDSGCRLVITDDLTTSAQLSASCTTTSSPPPQLTKQALATDKIALLHWQDSVTAETPTTWPQQPADHPAYMIYTSGTTGQPKASINSHGGLENLIANCQQWLQHAPVSPRIFQFAAMSFDASILELCLMLASGGSLYFAATDCRQRPDLLGQALADSEAGLVMLPPILLPQLEPAQLPTLHTLMTGGDRCPASEAQRWSETKQFYNLYGPSETSVLCAANPVHHSHRSDSLGQLIAGCQGWLMDQCGQPLPAGVPGELWLGGVVVSRGYHNREELTTCSFVSFAGQRYYRSGDRCISDEAGYLRILGRLDRQVKIRGVRVEPADVEQMLRRCNGVTDAVVLVRQDAGLITGLDACVTLSQGYPLSAVTLQQQLRQQLPGAAVPGHILLLEHWPMTTNGKVDRQQLEQQLATTDVGEDTDNSALFSPLAQTIARQLSTLLQQPVTRLDANFFELGGSSLQVAQFLAWLEQRHGLQLPLELFYQLASMQTLVDWMELYPDFNADALQALLPVTDLAADAQLEASIIPITNKTTAIQANGWLLTGATGFVGAHLCHQILQQHNGELFCLVRGRSTQQGLARLRQQLDALQLWQPEYEQRITVLCGDLAAPQLGLSKGCWQQLSQKLCHIVHCGAQVNFSSNYGLMKAANVEATHSLLALAATIPGCSFDFISTMSVMAALSQTPDSAESAEQLALDNWQALSGGYNQSKWVAEQLCLQARQRGMDASIYRLASVTGDLKTGICNTQDIIWRIADACRTLKAWPDTNSIADMTPADEVARIIVTLRNSVPTTQPRPAVLLLTNPASSCWYQLYAAVHEGQGGWQSLSVADWRGRLIDWLQQHPGASLAALLPFVNANAQQLSAPQWHCQITQQYLARYHLSFSAVTPQMLNCYLAAMPAVTTDESSGEKQ